MASHYMLRDRPLSENYLTDDQSRNMGTQSNNMISSPAGSPFASRNLSYPFDDDTSGRNFVETLVNNVTRKKPPNPPQLSNFRVYGDFLKLTTVENMKDLIDMKLEYIFMIGKSAKKESCKTFTNQCVRIH